MSRAAALADRKGAQKSAIAEKKASHEADLAMGLNKTVAQWIKDDEVLCTTCGATKKGPIVCACTGGRTKPSADYCPKQLLVDAANLRAKAGAVDKKKEALRKQNEVGAARAKKKGAGADDADMEFQGEGTEVSGTFQFPIGPLGFELQRNAVLNVTKDPALELGVKRGYLLHSVNGVDVPLKKEEIAKQIMAVYKEQKTGLVEFVFRMPITDGFVHCYKCDKYQDEAQFDDAQKEKGPGRMMCMTCEEFSGMF